MEKLEPKGNHSKQRSIKNPSGGKGLPEMGKRREPLRGVVYIRANERHTRGGRPRRTRADRRI